MTELTCRTLQRNERYCLTYAARRPMISFVPYQRQKKPKEKTFAELCALLDGRCSRKPSIVIRRFQFHSRSRKPNESVTDYTTALRKLVVACEFTTDVDEHLRDRLVCGINNVDMQRQLLKEDALVFKKATSIALAIEATERHLTLLASAQRPETRAAEEVLAQKANADPWDILRTTPDKRKTSAVEPKQEVARSVCFRCVSRQHKPYACLFRTASCHY